MIFAEVDFNFFLIHIFIRYIKALEAIRKFQKEQVSVILNGVIVVSYVSGLKFNGRILCMMPDEK